MSNRRVELDVQSVGVLSTIELLCQLCVCVSVCILGIFHDNRKLLAWALVGSNV